MLFPCREFETGRIGRQYNSQSFRQNIYQSAIETEKIFLRQLLEERRRPRIVQYEHIGVDIRQVTILQEIVNLIRRFIIYRLRHNFKFGHDKTGIKNFYFVEIFFRVDVDKLIAEKIPADFGDGFKFQIFSLMDSRQRFIHIAAGGVLIK